jgi:hypothetical protein
MNNNSNNEKHKKTKENHKITTEFLDITNRDVATLNFYDGLYKQNLDVSPKRSYYNLDTNFIHIECPLPNKKFKIQGAYYINRGLYSFIILHITDGTDIPTLDAKMKTVLRVRIPIKKLTIVNPKNGTFSPNYKEVIHVVVYNNNSKLQAANIFRYY